MSKYTINDIEVVSTTTIIGQLDKSKALMGWAVRMTTDYIRQNLDKVQDINDLLEEARMNYRDAQQEALDIGKEVHDRIEKYIKYDKDAVGDMPDEVQNAFLSFLEWESNNVEKWIESEKTIFDEKNLVGGTLDSVVKIKADPKDKFLIPGGIYVIDFKSSKGFYDGYDLQIAHYKYSRENMKGEYRVLTSSGEDFSFNVEPIKIDGIGVLRLDKLTGFPEWKDYTKNYDRALEAFCHLADYYYSAKKRRLKNNSRVK